MELENMRLPKVNARRQLSKDMKSELSREIRIAIRKTEDKFKYDFRGFEVDNVLLEIVQMNQSSYINEAFGSEKTY